MGSSEVERRGAEVVVTCGRCRVKADAEQYRFSQDDAVTLGMAAVDAVEAVLKIGLLRTVDRESARLAIAGLFILVDFECGLSRGCVATCGYNHAQITNALRARSATKTAVWSHSGFTILAFLSFSTLVANQSPRESSRIPQLQSP